MKIELLDGYLVEEKSGGNYVLKKRYMGKRNGVDTECEKIVSHHQSFDGAAESFLSLYKGSNCSDRLVSITEYINTVKEENSRAVQAVQECKMEHFFMYVPKGNGHVPEKDDIIDLIPIGRDNAISRKVLVQLCVNKGLIEEDVKDKDRVMRKLIEKARMNYTILNLSDGSGYYRVSKDDLQDLNRYIRQEEHRAKATFKNLSMAKKLYEDYRTGRL